MCQLGTCYLLQGCVWVPGWALSSRCCKPQGDELTSPSEDSNEPRAKFSPCFLQFYSLMLLLKNKQLSSFYAAFTLASMTAFSLQEPPAVCPGKSPSAKLVWGNSDIQWSQVSPWFANICMHQSARVQLWLSDEWTGLHWSQWVFVTSLIESLN